MNNHKATLLNRLCTTRNHSIDKGFTHFFNIFFEEVGRWWLLVIGYPLLVIGYSLLGCGWEKALVRGYGL